MLAHTYAYDVRLWAEGLEFPEIWGPDLLLPSEATIKSVENMILNCITIVDVSMNKR